MKKDFQADNTYLVLCTLFLKCGSLAGGMVSFRAHLDAMHFVGIATKQDYKRLNQK